MDGQAIVIPPLITIQQQMSKICEAWKIPYINLSNITSRESTPTFTHSQAQKIILASIEDLTDVMIQKYLLSLKISYVAVDECQVGKIKKLACQYFILTILEGYGS